MSENIQKFTTILLYILFGIGVIFVGLFYFGGVVEGTEGTIYQEPKITNQILTLGAIYFGIAAILALIFPAIYTILNIEKAIYGIIGVIFFLIILAISYLISNGQPVEVNVEVPLITFKLVDAGLIAAYILGGIAFLGIIISELSTLFK